MQGDLLRGHLDQNGALEDVQQLVRAGNVSVAGVAVARAERPVPQLDHVRRCGARDQDGAAAAITRPQHWPGAAEGSASQPSASGHRPAPTTRRLGRR